MDYNHSLYYSTVLKLHYDNWFFLHRWEKDITLVSVINKIVGALGNAYLTVDGEENALLEQLVIEVNVSTHDFLKIQASRK